MNPNENMLPENDALFEALQTLAAEITPEPQFKYRLEDTLKSAHKPRTSFHINRRDVFQFAGLTVALVLLAVLLSWAIRSIAPVRVLASHETATPTLAAPTSTPSGQAAPYIVQRGDTCAKIASQFGVSTDDLIAANGLAPNCADLKIGMELVIPIQGGIVAPQAESYDYNDITLYLNAELPSLPLEANIYTVQPDQHATIETARALALRFGIDGQVYNAPGEIPGTTDYLVTAGGPRLYVRSDNYFTYYRAYGGIYLGSRTLTDEQAAAAIADFMTSHGFEFEYTIEHAPQVYGAYYVVPLLDGQPLRYTYLMPARLEITLDDNGQVLQVNGSLLNAEKIGAYGIRTAEEAFQKIVSEAEYGTMQEMRSGGMVEMTLWMREYPEAQPLTLYGQIRTLPAAEAGQPPLITLSDFTLTGNTAGLETTQEDIMVEANGQFITQNGIRLFQVDSWKASEAQAFTAMGSLRKEGDQVILVADDGAEIPLVDAPADVPLNTQPPLEYMSADGTLVNGLLEWKFIQFMPTLGGGGGGGGGGAGLYQLNLTGTPIPLPTPVPTIPSTGGGGGGSGYMYTIVAGDTCQSIATTFNVPVEDLIGADGLPVDCASLQVDQTLTIQLEPPTLPQTVAGLRGMLIVNVYAQQDGAQRVEYNLTTSDPALPYVKLEGENLDELYNYHGRPVDVWGAIDHMEDFGIPVLKVERYEIPFPDLNFQILEGTQQITTITDQTALLFTTTDGLTYLQMGADCISLIGPDSLIGGGQVGERVQLEALLVPGLTYAGYPVACGFVSVPAIDPQSGQPNQLQVTSDQPYIMPDSPVAESNTTISMTIEKVELVYYVNDPRYTVFDPNGPPVYIQPMWRFYGHYSSGDEFEFLVQALSDEFLSPEIQPIEPPG